MPLNLDTPILRTAINSFKIKSFYADIKEQRIEVFYGKFADDESVGTGNMQITGDEFLSIIGSSVDSGIDLYANIKNKLYSHIAEKLGITGTVV